ncbi:LysR family transcriptional regulator, partial [Rhodococcus rhodochrous]
MDLHLVTYFVAVVDHGGITKAAQALYISQPSLSQAIRTLERRLDTTLFDRTGRRLTLTEDGRVLEVA